MGKHATTTSRIIAGAASVAILIFAATSCDKAATALSDRKFAVSFHYNTTNGVTTISYATADHVRKVPWQGLPHSFPNDPSTVATRHMMALRLASLPNINCDFEQTYHLCQGQLPSWASDVDDLVTKCASKGYSVFRKTGSWAE